MQDLIKEKMNELKDELTKLSLEYKKRSDELEICGGYKNIADAKNDGKSQAYWIVHNDLIKIVRSIM